MASAVASNDISMEEVKMEAKEEPMDQSEVSEELQKWIDAGLDSQVAIKVEDICKSGESLIFLVCSIVSFVERVSTFYNLLLDL